MLDSKVALPFLAPERERLLEYDITRAIANVSTTEKIVVGVASGLLQGRMERGARRERSPKAPATEDE